MKWTSDEEKYLLENYPNKNLDLKHFEERFKRSRDTIRHKAIEINVYRGYKEWTQEDQNYLINNYKNPKINPEYFEKVLDRKWNNIISKANKLGLVRNVTIITDSRNIEINDPNYIYECSICNKPKPNNQYSRDRKKKGKGREYVTQCKDCRRLYQKLPHVRENQNKRHILQRKKHRINSVYWSSVSNARNRGTEHTITKDDIKELFEIQKGLCYYTNKPMLQDIRDTVRNDDSLSIDRFDSSKGYIKGNIVLCRWIVNRMKNDIEFKQFLELVSDINKNFNK